MAILELSKTSTKDIDGGYVSPAMKVEMEAEGEKYHGKKEEYRKGNDVERYQRRVRH